MTNEPAPRARSEQRSVLGIVFLTVFLDMVGFSVIFPLFPAMLDWYVEREGEASLAGRLVAWLGSLVENRFAVVALFGGILGALYSLLQFLAAPLWGRLSDRRGRRGVLLVTLCGTALSYVLWFFSGSFALLVVARLVGGAMAGNISIASAATADVLSGRDRARGMGMLGAGIGLGFVVGPAIGGWAAGLDVTDLWAGAADAGVNPFSGAAAIAFGLALVNLLWAALRFPETNPPTSAGRRAAELRALEPRSWNPFGKLRELAFPGVKALCLAHFVYSCAFGAMEFSLVFLATEHLGYAPLDNAKLFVFIGLTIAVVQGGIVRRLVPRLGERKVAGHGLVVTLLGFIALGLVPFEWAASVGRGTWLWVGAGLVAIGTSLVMPSFSTLASRYVPDDRQGFALGVFRSLGSLARVVGPLAGGLLYYSLGGWSPYLIGALVIMAPLRLATGLPEPPAHAPEPAPGPRQGAAGAAGTAGASPPGRSAR
jgi:MFS family permease